MELLAIVLIIICYVTSRWGADAPDDSASPFYLHSTPPKKQKKTSSAKSFFTDEDSEDGSFFDSDGFEHIIDEEGYCFDCDDYHDD